MDDYLETLLVTVSEYTCKLITVLKHLLCFIILRVRTRGATGRCNTRHVLPVYIVYALTLRGTRTLRLKSWRYYYKHINDLSHVDKQTQDHLTNALATLSYHLHCAHNCLRLIMVKKSNHYVVLCKSLGTPLVLVPILSLSFIWSILHHWIRPKAKIILTSTHFLL